MTSEAGEGSPITPTEPAFFRSPPRSPVDTEIPVPLDPTIDEIRASLSTESLQDFPADLPAPSPAEPSNYKTAIAGDKREPKPCVDPVCEPKCPVPKTSASSKGATSKPAPLPVGRLTGPAPKQPPPASKFPVPVRPGLVKAPCVVPPRPLHK